jgi:hypothetical protein
MSNLHTIRLYGRGKLLDSAQFIAVAALDPETPEAVAERLVGNADIAGLMRIVDALALAPLPPLKTARDFAHALAHGARLVREIVAEHCRQDPVAPPLRAVRRLFNDQLFARPEAGGYDAEDGDADFAAAFAQTLAFGLLLARETAGYRREVTRDAYRMLPEGRYPLLWATLRAITQDEMLRILGAGFDVVQDTVNAATADLLARRPDRADPILYFYEEFLEVFDPRARKQYGVFFTPVAVVNYIVHETERALREQLGTDGFLDGKVHTLDPACGTGTFLFSAIAHAAARVEADHGEGSVPAALKHFAGRLHAFELLVGAYTVAQFRLLRELADRRVSGGVVPQIRLADTLAPVTDQPLVTTDFDFMNRPIVDERIAADLLKARERILAIFGNPPYRRLKKGEVARLVGPWMDKLWDDLKKPVREAGLGLSLNPFPDLYIAFWRWALWRLFEAPGAERRGVVAFITNRGFLAGRAFGGLRQMLRARFDDIRVLDLRGDNRGALPVGAEADDNVFNIETGVCIVVAVARGGERADGAEAAVHYADTWRAGAFRRADKLALLDSARQGLALPWAPLPGARMDRLKPVGFAGRDWPALDQVFRFRSNGIVTYRDHFAYATTRAVLEDRIREFLRMPADEAKKLFGESTLRKSGPAQRVPFDATSIEQVVYRPLDRRFLYNRSEYLDRPRADMQTAWGTVNVALMSLEDGTGRGPAAWCHGQKPDQHAFRGSYGGWVFPLRDHATGPNAHFLDPRVIEGLSLSHGTPPTALDVLDATLALLSARGYTTRFAADLEDDFPHIPFPPDRERFAEAARIGAEIRALQTFARAPAAEYRRARISGTGQGVTLQAPKPSAFAGDAVPLLADQSLRLSGISEAVWTFEVSGYRLLHKWLSGRDGDALDAGLLNGARDVADRIAELMHWFEQADALLDSVMEDALPRADFGLGSAGAESARALEGADDVGQQPPA